MGEDPRRKTKGPFSTSSIYPLRVSRQDPPTMYERRGLNPATLSRPEYHISPQNLIDNFVEMEVKFAGVITGVQLYVDVTNRTEVLRIIDRGKKEGVITMHTSYEPNAVLSLSVGNIKITKRGGNEDLLLRVPMHEVAAMCYIKDDGVHILAMKHGNPDLCNLAVLMCPQKQIAEQICALIGQCFQIIYTEATVQFLDDFNHIANVASLDSSVGSSTPTNPRASFISGSTSDIPGYLRNQPHYRSQSTKSDSEISTSGHELLKDYMSMLQKKLSVEELRQFACLLRDWHQNAQFSEFCEGVFQLYKRERIHLLSEMSPFIPEKDYEFFEQFLSKHGVTLPENHGTMSSFPSLPRPYSRSISEVSSDTQVPNETDLDMNQDMFGDMLNYISKHIDNLDSSIDISPNMDPFIHPGPEGY